MIFLAEQQELLPWHPVLRRARVQRLLDEERRLWLPHFAAVGVVVRKILVAWKNSRAPLHILVRSQVIEDSTLQAVETGVI